MTYTTTTKTVSRTDLVGVSSVAWIRPQRVQFSVTNTKPNTVLYPFFDGASVSTLVNSGAQIKTDISGTVSGFFDIPPYTFNTGEKEFKLQETPVYNRDSTTGSILGSARAIFKTSGVANTYRETVDTFNDTTFFLTVNIIDPAPPKIIGPQDPLAQSFFTYGVTGGCFITKIDCFFKTRDSAIPVRLEIRELVNGLPGTNLANPLAFVSVNPANVNLSDNALAATSFVFPGPVYLPENRDWCFVLLSNSNMYEVWTSRLGENAKETGKNIFEQPFIGSMFKSENNITWTAEQTEDIKFTIYKAKFDTASQASVSLRASANPYLLEGGKMSVTSGSPLVTVTFDHQHGLRANDYVRVVAQSGGIFQGIPAANISSAVSTDFTVVTVIDDYNITFNAKSSALGTGDLSNPGMVNSVLVDSSGSGYPSNTTITFAAPPSGTTATAVLVIVGGKIVGVTVNQRGSGYLTAPGYTLSFASSNPAALTVVSEAIFEVTTNNVAHGYKPLLTSASPPNTQVSSRVKYTDNNYQIGEFQAAKINFFHNTNKRGIVLSDKNASAYLPNQVPTELSLTLSSTNENTSPLLALNEERKLQTYAFAVNNAQSYDDVVEIANETALGAGPGIANTVYLALAEQTEWAWINSSWASVNSEFRATGGAAISKYLSRQFTLETLSKGARVFATAESLSESSFDIYIRTSLSGSGIDHSKLRWSKMRCAVARNLSKRQGEFLDYEFYLDGINDFDVYDIKIVFLSSNAAIVPRLSDYRAIILAT